MEGGVFFLSSSVPFPPQLARVVGGFLELGNDGIRGVTAAASACQDGAPSNMIGWGGLPLVGSPLAHALRAHRRIALSPFNVC